MKITACLGVMIAACSIAGAQVDLSQEPALDKKVSLTLPIASLSDFAKKLQAESGVQIAATQNIADRKITALFRDQSLREVMEQVAALYDAVWQKDEKTYRLEVPQKTLQAEQDLIRQETRLRRNYVEMLVQQWSQFVANYSIDELYAEAGRLFEELKPLKGDQSATGKKLYNDTLQRYQAMVQGCGGYTTGYVLSKLSGSQRENFWNGETVVGSTKQSDGGVFIPKEYIRKNPPLKTKEGQIIPPEANLVIARYKPHSGLFQVVEQEIILPIGGSAGNSVFMKPAGGMDKELANHPFRVMAEQWKTPINAEGAQEVLNTHLDLRSAGVLSSPYRNKGLPLFDHLAWLHKASGLNILAEPDRRTLGFTAQVSAQDVRSWLSVVMNNSDTGFGGSVRIQKNWISFRSADFWRQRLDEVPEKIYTVLESKLAQNKQLTVDDYGWFAAQLNDRQLDTFSARWQICSLADLSPLADAPVALKFWGTLAPSEKSQARSRDGLLASSLRASSFLYWSAAREALWSRQVRDGQLRTVLCTGRDPSGQMRFFFSEDKNVDLLPTSLKRTDESGVPITGVGYETVKGAQFAFGPSPDMSVKFECSFSR